MPAGLVSEAPLLASECSAGYSKPLREGWGVLIRFLQMGANESNEGHEGDEGRSCWYYCGNGCKVRRYPLPMEELAAAVHAKSIGREVDSNRRCEVTLVSKGGVSETARESSTCARRKPLRKMSPHTAGWTRVDFADRTAHPNLSARSNYQLGDLRDGCSLTDWPQGDPKYWVCPKCRHPWLLSSARCAKCGATQPGDLVLKAIRAPEHRRRGAHDEYDDDAWGEGRPPHRCDQRRWRTIPDVDKVGEIYGSLELATRLAAAASAILRPTTLPPAETLPPAPSESLP